MRWRLGLRPSPRWGSLRRPPRSPNRKRQRAFGARHSLFRVYFYISIPLPGPSLTEFLDPPLHVAINGPRPSLRFFTIVQTSTFKLAPRLEGGGRQLRPAGGETSGLQPSGIDSPTLFPLLSPPSLGTSPS